MRGLFLFSVAFTGAVVIDCGLPSDIFKIQEAKVVPSNPHVGENTTLYLKFNNTGEPIVDGTAKVGITYNFIPFSPSIESICRYTNCPIASGITNHASSTLWPFMTGSISIKTVWRDLDGRQLLCFEVKEQTFEHDSLEGL